jgi:DNA polymerase V
MQQDLFTTVIAPTCSQLMQIVDSIKVKYGSNMLQFAAEGIDKKWKVRADSRSPRYTTCWTELVRVY